MKKEIKVRLNNFVSETMEKDFFPIRVLRENFNIKFMDKAKDADVIFEVVSRGSNFKFLKEKKKKVILISSEDLLIKRNIFNLIESGLHKILKNIKYKIMDKLDALIPNFISGYPLFYLFPHHLKFIKKINKGKINNAYGIIQNDLPGRNIFIIPYFLNLFYYKMPDLIKNKHPDIIDRKLFCAFIVSSNSSRERVKFFKKLSKYKQVDSYGRVLNNRGDQLFNSKWYSTHDELFKTYKFVICFENNFSKSYMTEKLPYVMIPGAIPIYRGASNVGDYFNTKSFINYDDFGSYDKMIKKIIELDQDDKKYLEFTKRPWFKDNKIPEIIKTKEKDLIKFYKKIFKDI